MNTQKKCLYAPPLAKDIGILSSNGQVRPQGDCTSGYYPYSDCQLGEYHTAGACNNGSLPGPSGCGAGNTPTGNQCSPVGSNAQNLCRTGYRA